MKKIVKGAVNRAATAFPPFRRLVQFGNEMWGKSQGFQNLYSKETASPANAFTIFSGEWSTAVPGFDTGKSPLFNDDRMKWTLGQLSSLQGKRVLELGALEGGHTWMLKQAGAKVTAIEANQRAFLKCLVVKNALHLETEFVYGDFCPYVAAAAPNSFDLVVAFGVLYHMAEPVKLLHHLGRITDAFALWTHYYDREVLADRAVRFDSIPQLQSVNGNSVQVYQQRYLSSVARPGFCGGSAPISFWLSGQGCLTTLRAWGLRSQLEASKRAILSGRIFCYSRGDQRSRRQRLLDLGRKTRHRARHDPDPAAAGIPTWRSRQDQVCRFVRSVAGLCGSVRWPSLRPSSSKLQLTSR